MVDSPGIPGSVVPYFFGSGICWFGFITYFRCNWETVCLSMQVVLYCFKAAFCFSIVFARQRLFFGNVMEKLTLLPCVVKKLCFYLFAILNVMLKMFVISILDFCSAFSTACLCCKYKHINYVERWSSKFLNYSTGKCCFLRRYVRVAFSTLPS